MLYFSASTLQDACQIRHEYDADTFRLEHPVVNVVIASVNASKALGKKLRHSVSLSIIKVLCLFVERINQPLYFPVNHGLLHLLLC